jgi:hypothetical protein
MLSFQSTECDLCLQVLVFYPELATVSKISALTVPDVNLSLCQSVPQLLAILFA